MQGPGTICSNSSQTPSLCFVFLIHVLSRQKDEVRVLFFLTAQLLRTLIVLKPLILLASAFLLFGTLHTTQKYDFRRLEYATPKYTSLMYFEAAILRNQRHRSAEKLYFCGRNGRANSIRMMAAPDSFYHPGEALSPLHSFCCQQI